MFTIACGKCGQNYEVDQEYCGASFECVSCGETIVVPMLEQDNSKVFVQPQPQPRPQQQPSRLNSQPVGNSSKLVINKTRPQSPSRVSSTYSSPSSFKNPYLSQRPNRSSNTWFKLIFFIIVLGLIGGGVYFFVNDSKKDTSTNVSDNNTPERNNGGESRDDSTIDINDYNARKKYESKDVTSVPFRIMQVLKSDVESGFTFVLCVLQEPTSGGRFMDTEVVFGLMFDGSDVSSINFSKTWVDDLYWAGYYTYTTVENKENTIKIFTVDLDLSVGALKAQGLLD